MHLILATFENMKHGMVLLVVTLLSVGCEKYCTEESILGHLVEIPLDLSKYSINEASYIYVINAGTSDTIFEPLTHFLLHKQVRESNFLTDYGSSGYYESSLNGRKLFFSYAGILMDSMTNIVIKKSQEKISDKCHKDDPNIQIDELSFTHDGVVKGKGDVVALKR
ncbi:MAG: hypothetical protein ACI9AU_001808 [Bacteroidia bacterium]|jgi:hypothetical protein